MKVLILGASGGIGSVIAKRFPEAICPTHKELDLEYLSLADGPCDVIIYCAGINHIQKTTMLQKMNLGKEILIWN